MLHISMSNEHKLLSVGPYALSDILTRLEFDTGLSSSDRLLSYGASFVSFL